MFTKQTRLICAILLIALLICGCTRKIYYRTSEEYNLSNISDSSFVQVDRGDDDVEISIIKSLNPEEFELFLSEFLQLGMYKYWNDPHQYKLGNNIMITFKNGDYHLINPITTVHFSGDKPRYQRVYYIGDTFELFWKKYTGLDFSDYSM